MTGRQWDTSGAGGDVVVAVYGPTASGKSAAAVALAERFGGELICADSRTVYRDLKIGAAGPTRSELAAVAHHLVAVLAIDELLTGPEFALRAEQVTVSILRRGCLPIVVGGTQLFMTAALHDVRFEPAPPSAELDWVRSEPLEHVWERFTAAGVALPLAWRRRDVLERVWVENRVAAVGGLRRPTIAVGMSVDVSVLETQIADRVDAMLAAGLEQEVRAVCARTGWRADELFSIGYEEWAGVFTGNLSRAELRETLIANTVTYAQRQRRWLAGVDGVCWVDGVADALDVVACGLAGRM